MQAPPPPARSNSPDFLREALAQQRRAGPASFEFLVQLQTDAQRMPIEDPTINWDEALSHQRHERNGVPRREPNSL